MTALIKKAPEACILAAGPWLVGYCGREIPADEFRFTDAEYAVKNYANSNTIRACPQCCAAVTKKFKSNTYDGSR